MTKQTYGVLILHGFSASLDCVNGIEPPIQELGIPTRMPVLRGHNTPSPEALVGVKWQDWVADGEAAYQELLKEVQRPIVFGHSMGALVALTLGADHPAEIDSLILAAPAVALTNPFAYGSPLHFLSPLASIFLKQAPMKPAYTDPALAAKDTNYRWVPTEAASELFEMMKATRKRLPEIKMPVTILQSHKDGTVPEKAVNIIYDNISTPPSERKTIWFETSGHEMFRDCESCEMIQTVVDTVRDRMQLAAPQPEA